MRPLNCAVLVFAVFSLVAVSPAQQALTTAVPNLISYSGTIVVPGGGTEPAKTVGVTFAIYGQQDGGAPLWLETQSVTTDSTGHYSVLLGSTRAEGIPANMFNTQEQRWLGVQVQGQQEQPRVLLVSVPYAMKAADAETVGGLPPSAFVQKPPSSVSGNETVNTGEAVVPGLAGPIGGGGATNYIPIWTSNTNLGKSTIYETGGNVGIGTTTPVQRLTVAGNVYANGLLSALTKSNIVQAERYESFSGPVLSFPGHENLYVGSSAGEDNAGLYNVFVGIEAGQHHSAGSYNVFLGDETGEYNTGSENVFLGQAAGLRNTDGEDNTFVGWASGRGNVGGSDNIYVGYTSGQNATGSNNIYLGEISSTIHENNTIRIGTNQSAAYLGGIYGNQPSGALPVVVNSNGQLGTTTQGIGVTSWNGRTGAVVPQADDYSFSLVSGTVASSQLTGTYSNAVTLSNTSNAFAGNGSGLTGVLPAAGSPYYIQNGTALQSATFNISGSGLANSFNSVTTYQISGSNVLSIGSSSDQNLFVGLGAGVNNVIGSGISNTFAGYEAGANNTTGGSNTFTGSTAGQSNITGSGNTFEGGGAGSANLSGSENTFLGGSAGSNSLTGSYNVFLGSSAGSNNQTGSNDIYISNAGPSSQAESNTIRIGTQGTGLGQQNTAYIAGVYGSTVGGNGVAVYVDSNGLLGTTVSSRRFKEQIRDMGDSSNALMKLRPVTFLYKPEYDKGQRTLQYGLIAEEVAEVYPDLVAYDPNGKPYTVKYQYLTTMLLNEVQKQYRRAEAAAEVIKSQEQKIGELEQRLFRLESVVETSLRTSESKTAYVPEGNPSQPLQPFQH